MAHAPVSCSPSASGTGTEDGHVEERAGPCDPSGIPREPFRSPGRLWGSVAAVGFPGMILASSFALYNMAILRYAVLHPMRGSPVWTSPFFRIPGPDFGGVRVCLSRGSAGRCGRRVHEEEGLGGGRRWGAMASHPDLPQGCFGGYADRARRSGRRRIASVSLSRRHAMAVSSALREPARVSTDSGPHGALERSEGRGRNRRVGGTDRARRRRPLRSLVRPSER